MSNNNQTMATAKAPRKKCVAMRDTMVHFVCALRAIDEFKRAKARKRLILAEIEDESKSKYLKPSHARSLEVDDVTRYLENSALDIDFMAQLPSIEKCLAEWWKSYLLPGEEVIYPDQLRVLYYDLANVLVESKTETTHKNTVSMIMTGYWAKWNPHEEPLSQKEFNRIVFLLAHLMTSSTRLGDYVSFLQDTLAKVNRYQQTITKQRAKYSRKPRLRRKSTMREIMSAGITVIPVALKAKSPESSPRTKLTGELAGGMTTLTLHMGQMVKLEQMLCDTRDRHVEIVNRTKTSSQLVTTDAKLLEESFQSKWHRLSDHAASSNHALMQQNPESMRFFPPLYIRKVKLPRPVHASIGKCASAPRLQQHPRPLETLQPHVRTTRQEQADPQSPTMTRTPTDSTMAIAMGTSSTEALLESDEVIEADTEALARAQAELEQDERFLQSLYISEHAQKQTRLQEEKMLRRSLTGMLLKPRIETNKQHANDKTPASSSKHPVTASSSFSNKASLETLYVLG